VSVFMRVQGNSSNSIYSKVMKMKTTTAYKPPHFTVSVRNFFLCSIFLGLLALCVAHCILFFFFPIFLCLG
jgi:hypothetical protein